MESKSQDGTRPSMFSRLRHAQPDSAEWMEFTTRYAPLIYVWCQRWGLQKPDADDVTQNVLVRFIKNLPRFRYDASQGGFRAWLRRVTRNVLTDLSAEKRKSVPANQNDAIVGLLDNVQARDDLERRLIDDYDQELVEKAAHAVQDQVQPKTWEAFRRTAVDGQDPADVAAELDMPIASVYTARSNVTKRMRKEVHRLAELEEQL